MSLQWRGQSCVLLKAKTRDGWKRGEKKKKNSEEEREREREKIGLASRCIEQIDQSASRSRGSLRRADKSDSS